MEDSVRMILSHADLFVSGLVSLCIIGGVVLEKLPINIHPLRWIGNSLNQDIKKDITDLSTRLSKVEKDVMNNDLQAKRSIVLNFADKLRRTDYSRLGEICTLEDFENVIDVMCEYEQLIEKYNIPNGKFDVAKEYILYEFTRLSKEGKFVELNNGKK